MAGNYWPADQWSQTTSNFENVIRLATTFAATLLLLVACSDNESAAPAVAPSTVLPTPLLQPTTAPTGAPLPPPSPAAAPLASESEPPVWPPDPAIYAPGIADHDPGPLAPRLGHGMVGLPDGRIAVWGGKMEGPNFGRPDLGWVEYTDGAVFDPNTDDWQPMSTGPLLATGTNGVHGVRLGVEVFWFRGTAAAAWNWEKDTWRELASAPGEVRSVAIVNAKILAVGADAIYDPGLDSWTVDEDMRTATAWQSKVFDAVGGPVVFRSQGRRLVVQSRETDGTWTVHTGGPDASWGDAVDRFDQIIVATERGAVMALDLATGTWQVLPDLPLQFWKADPRLHRVGVHVIAFAGPGVAVLDGDQWHVSATTVGQGTSVASLGRLWTYGLNQGEPAFTSLDPSEIVTSPWTLVQQWPFDSTNLTFELTADSDVGLLGAPIRGQAESDQLSCRLAVGGYTGPNPTAVRRSSQVYLGNRYEDGVGITCEDPAQAEQLLARFAPSRAEIEAARYEWAARSLGLPGAWNDALTAVGLAVRPDGLRVRHVSPDGATVAFESDVHGTGLIVNDLNLAALFGGSETITAIGGLWMDCLPPTSVGASYSDTIAVLTTNNTDQSCASPALRLYVDHRDHIVAIDVFVPATD